MCEYCDRGEESKALVVGLTLEEYEGNPAFEIPCSFCEETVGLGGTAFAKQKELDECDVACQECFANLVLCMFSMGITPNINFIK